MSDAMDSLQDQLDNISLSVLADDAPTTKLTLPNLPLPRELRDIIYSYLLYHEHVHDVPYHRKVAVEEIPDSELPRRLANTAHTYRFHVSILAVNQQIHDEASKVLQSNHFVIVSHRWTEPDDLSDIIYRLGVPIVCDNRNHIAKFQLHKLRVHVQAPAGGKQTLDSFLMVSYELPRLCRSLQRSFFDLHSPARHIVHLRGTPPSQFLAVHSATAALSKCQAPAIKIQIQEGTEEPVIERLLGPFRNVIFGSLRVKILNGAAVGAVYVENLERSMGPRTVWMNALMWQMLKTARELLTDAFDQLHDKNVGRALLLYESVWKISDKILFYKGDVLRSDVAEPFGILASVIFNAAIMHSFLEIRAGLLKVTSTAHRLRIIEELINKVTNLPSPERETTAMAYLLARWHSIICSFLIDRNTTVLQTATQAMQELQQQSIARHEDMSIQEYIAHDLKLMEYHAFSPTGRVEYLNSQPSTLRTLCKASAAANLDPLILTNSRHFTQTPKTIQGYIDTNHLEQVHAHDPKLAEELVGDMDVPHNGA